MVSREVLYIENNIKIIMLLILYMYIIFLRNFFITNIFLLIMFFEYILVNFSNSGSNKFGLKLILYQKRLIIDINIINCEHYKVICGNIFINFKIFHNRTNTTTRNSIFVKLGIITVQVTSMY